MKMETEMDLRGYLQGNIGKTWSLLFRVRGKRETRLTPRFVAGLVFDDYALSERGH